MNPQIQEKMQEVRLKLRAAVDAFVEVERMLNAEEGRPNPAPQAPGQQEQKGAGTTHTDTTSERAQVCVDIITAWSEEHPEFEMEFVESVAGQIENGNRASAAQLAALETIIQKFRIRK